jgi:hypothetical protein
MPTGWRSAGEERSTQRRRSSPDDREMEPTATAFVALEDS